MPRHDASPKYAGRKVIVVGTGTSGHDIAQCCQKHGADVTIIQRSPTFIVSLDTVQKTVAPRYNNRTVSPPKLLSSILAHYFDAAP
jgi:cation diffusion facilitator CzcD-associated flavoprotein CzcO